MQQKIKFYINLDSLLINEAFAKKINSVFIESMKYMQLKWSKLFDLYFYGESADNIDDMNILLKYEVIDKPEIPTQINKLYYLLDDNFDFLCAWERAGGKAIAYIDYLLPNEQWSGLKLKENMNTEEMINALRHIMHLY